MKVREWGKLYFLKQIISLRLDADTRCSHLEKDETAGKRAGRLASPYIWTRVVAALYYLVLLPQTYEVKLLQHIAQRQGVGEQLGHLFGLGRKSHGYVQIVGSGPSPSCSRAAAQWRMVLRVSVSSRCASVSSALYSIGYLSRYLSI